MVLSRRAALLAALALGAGLGACSGLTPGNAYDQPLYRFDGTFISNSALPAGTRPLLAVLWTDPLQRQQDVLMPASWISATVDPGDVVPETVHAQLFRPPPPEAMVEIAAPGGAGTARLALGEIVIADDADRDGVIHVGGPSAAIETPASESAARDSYIAGAVEALLYVEHPLTPSQASFPFASFGAGYHVVNFLCAGKASGGTEEWPGVEFVAQTSQVLPEIRDCLRTHAP
jgi:hypothetical protein